MNRTTKPPVYTHRTAAGDELSVPAPPRSLSPRQRALVIRADRLILGLTRRWLLVFNLVIGIYVGLPWLAPVLMNAGFEGAGQALYSFYATQCHQLPQRSFFLFGPKSMIPLADIQAGWYDTSNPAVLRQFIGGPEWGWKVAWSDRMVFMYGALLVAGLLYGLVRRRLQPLPVWGLALFLLPMALDGGAHLVSDLAGIGQGFRDSNAWLAALTGNSLPASFYAGDALGSFNSLMRFISGLLFGVGVVWFAYPHLETYMRDTRLALETKLRRAGVIK